MTWIRIETRTEYLGHGRPRHVRNHVGLLTPGYHLQQWQKVRLETCVEKRKRELRCCLLLVRRYSVSEFGRSAKMKRG